MSKLAWDVAGQHWYEAGVSQGVLYPMTVTNGVSSYGTGIAWNGLTSVSESPDGADANDLWADNIKYASLRAAETFGGTIEAYTYPDEWAECDGSRAFGGTGGTNNFAIFGQQPRKSFGLCFKTEMGNDTDSSIDDGVKYHLIYNCTASPSDRQYETINDSPDAITFSWEFTSNPVAFTTSDATGAGLKPVSCIILDGRKMTKAQRDSLEDKLYGSATDAQSVATLPTPDQVYAWAVGGGTTWA